MSKFQHLENVFNTIFDEAIISIRRTEEQYEKKFQTLLDKFKKDVAEYEATGILPTPNFNISTAIVENTENEEPKRRGRPPGRATTNIRASSRKENNSALANTSEPERSSRRTRLTPLNENEENAFNNPTLPVVKIERPTDSFNGNQNNIADITKKIKQEAEDMPPPSRPPLKRTRGRKAVPINNSTVNIDLNGVSIKKDIINKDSADRQSDVIVQNDNVLNITVIDSDEDEQSIKKRPKRTRTKRKLPENISSASDESGTDVPKADTSTKSTRAKLRNAPQVEDPPQSGAERPLLMDITVVLSKDNLQANETFVVDKALNYKSEKQLLTDDEDIIDNSIKETNTKKIKQIFNPYAPNPVKTRVAAFEQLATPRSTRAKAKQLVEQAEAQEDNKSPQNNKGRSGIPKLRTTPLIDNRIVSHLKGTDPNHNPLLASKTRSETKASEVEYKERELRKKQKDSNALQKKEALLAAQIEEKRRRNEERQLKAQQHRDALEKEKQQLIEAAGNAKINKLKQIMAEKEEKLVKQKDEANKKRQMALKKAAMEKKKLEEEQKKMNGKEISKNGVPLLPTVDCYDSDDPTTEHKRIQKPAWQTSHSLQRALLHQSYIYKAQNTLFSCGPQYPEASSIFPGSKPVTRNSSVIWDTSNMSILHSIMEEDA